MQRFQANTIVPAVTAMSRAAAVGVLGGVFAGAWLALLLGEFGRFRSWPCWALAAGVALLVMRWETRRSPKPLSSSEALTRLLVVVLAGLTLIATAPAGEWILGGWDPGVYVNTAASLSHDGSLNVAAPDLAACDSQTRSLLGRERDGVWEPFSGMRMREDGHLSPQFFHLYPCVMALLWPLGGVRSALLANPLLNVGCIVLVYLLGAPILGRRWAALASLFMAVNPAQLWQAKFSTSEMLTQFLLLCGVVFAGRSFREEGPPGPSAALAGVALGLALLARVDSVLFAAPFGLGLLAVGLRDKARRSRALVMLSVGAALAAHALLHQRYLAPFYHPAGGLVRWGVAAAVVAAVVLAAGMSAASGRRVVGWMGGRRAAIRLMLAAGFVAWMVFQWYVRPRLAVEGRVFSAVTALFPLSPRSLAWAVLAGSNSSNFFYVRAILGWPGIILATLGLAVLIRRVGDPIHAVWLGAALLTLAAWMTVLFHETFMMFIARRLIPVVVPLLAVGLAAGCAWGSGRFSRWPRLVPWVAAGLIAAALAGQARAAAAMGAHREWPGLVGWFERVASELPADAVVYTDQGGFGAPLRFIHGVRAAEFRLGIGFERQLALMEKAAGAAPVFFLTQNPIPGGSEAAFAAVARLRLDSSALASASHNVPLAERARGGPFILYRLRAGHGSLGERPRVPEMERKRSFTGRLGE